MSRQPEKAVLHLSRARFSGELQENSSPILREHQQLEGLQTGYFVNAYFEFQCTEEKHNFQRVGRSPVFVRGVQPFSCTSLPLWWPSRHFSRILKVPVCKVPVCEPMSNAVPTRIWELSGKKNAPGSWPPNSGTFLDFPSETTTTFSGSSEF